MRAVRNFEEFISENIIKKQSSDKSRSNFLASESERSYLFLMEMIKKTEITDQNANFFVKNCYDIIMEMIRAKMFLDGYKSEGFGSHEAEVSYLRNLGFNENDVQFVDRLRFFRNGMLYYGTVVDKEYAEKVIEFTKKNYLKLKIMLK